MRKIFIILIILSFVGIVYGVTFTTEGNTNSLPSTSTPTLTPSPSYTTSNITCSATLTDPEQASLTAYYNFYVNGIKVFSANASASNNTNTELGVLDSGNFSKGDVIICEVTPYDGIDNGTAQNSSSLTIQNSIPTIGNPTINNTSPQTNDVLLCENGSYNDDDGDAAIWYYKWWKQEGGVGDFALISGETSNTLSLTCPGCDKHDVIKCSSIASDGTSNATDWTNSSSVTILNTPPTISTPTINNTSPYTNDIVNVTGNGYSDADGDSATWYYSWWISTDGGTSYNQISGQTSNVLNLNCEGCDKGDLIYATTIASDGEANSTPQDSAPFTIQNSPPTIGNPTINNTTPKTNDIIKCINGSYSDLDLDPATWYYRWWEQNGGVGDFNLITGQNSNTLNLSLNGLDKNDVLKCGIIASDGEANASDWTNSSSITIQNTPPSISNVQLKIYDVGGTENISLQITATDDDGLTDLAIANYTTYQSSFSSGIANLDIGDSLSQSNIIYINDSSGAVDSFNLTFTLTPNTYEENTTFPSSLSNQSIILNSTLTNNGVSSFSYYLNHSTPSGGSLGSLGEKSGSLGVGSSINFVDWWYGDWVVSETEGTSSLSENASYPHTLTQQEIINTTNLSVNNQQSFTFHNVDVSSICSLSSSANISSGVNTIVSECNDVGYLGDWITGETEETYSLFENSSFTPSLTTQKIINQTKLTVTNSQSFSFTNVDLSSLCENTATATIASGTNLITTNCSWEGYSGDWITGEVEGLEFQYANNSKVQNETTQYIINQTYLNTTNSQSFTFTNVDLSSICSQTTSANITTGTNKITNDCNKNEYAVDVIDSTTSSPLQDVAHTSNLSKQYIYEEKVINNVGSWNFTNISISPPSILGSCVNCNTRYVSLNSGDSTTQLYNSSSDFLSESEGSWRQDTTHTIRSGETAYITKNITIYNNFTSDLNNIILNIGNRSGWSCSPLNLINITSGSWNNISQSNNCSKNNVITELTTYTPLNNTINVNKTIWAEVSVELNNTDSLVNYTNVVAYLDDNIPKNESSRWTNLTPTRFNVNLTSLNTTTKTFNISGIGIDWLPTSTISCPIGWIDYGSYCMRAVDVSDGTRYEYKFYVNVTNNFTKEKPINFTTPLSNYVDWDKRTSLTYDVNGSATDMNLYSLSPSVIIEVGSSHSFSSLEEGDYVYDTTYKVLSPVATPAPSGGGGGGPASIVKPKSTIKSFNFEDLNHNFTVKTSEGSVILGDFKVTNLLGENILINILKSKDESCDWLSFEGNGIKRSEIYNLTINSATPTTPNYQFISYEIDVPYNIENKTYICRLTVEDSKGYYEMYDYVIAVGKSTSLWGGKVNILTPVKTSWMRFKEWMSKTLFRFGGVCNDISPSRFENATCASRGKIIEVSRGSFMISVFGLIVGLLGIIKTIGLARKNIRGESINI